MSAKDSTVGVGGYKYIAKCLREYSEKHFGEIIACSQIIEDIHTAYNCRRDEIIPSDYAINPDKNRKAKMMEPRLFKRIERGRYECIGAVYTKKESA